ncbi:MAG: hypothetical protein M1825_003458 [Sarcosagium campestre]|nr:MAG: hypothetical protein M1825_003458 [Sarcosagium campestre]
MESGYDKLSLAVIHRSESEVHTLIRQGFDPNGNPNNKDLYTPLNLALGWPLGMLALLDAGADPCCTMVPALLDPDDESLSLLLTYRCTIFHTSSHLLRRCFQPQHHSSNGILTWALCRLDNSHRRDLVIRRFIHDRRQLTDLALAKLTDTERRKACIESLSDGRLLDKSASSAYLALCRKGVNVPAGLGPSDRLEESVYHDPAMCVEVAEQLYSAGFYSVGDKGWSWTTPNQTMNLRLNHRQLEMTLWFLDKDALPHIDDARNLLFQAAFQTLHWPSSPERWESFNQLIQKVSSRCHSLYGPVIRDQCLCYCTSYGCAASVHAYKWVIRHGSKEFLKLSAHKGELDMTAMQVETWREEVCRLIIFERLGMAHTCCDDRPGRCRVSSEEAQELRQEDANYKEALDLYMCLYKNLRKEHSGPFLEFWANWWTIVDKRLPLKPFRNKFWEEQDESPTSTDEPLDEPVIDDDGYFPNVDEITSFMRSKSRHWGQEDYVDIFSDAIDLFS